MRVSSPNRIVAGLAGLGLVAGLVAVTARDSAPGDTPVAATADCAPGTIPVAEFVRREQRLRASTAAQGFPQAENEAAELLESGGLDLPGLCISEKHPEPIGELLARAADNSAPRRAGMGTDMRAGAFAAAAAERAAMEPGSVEGTAGTGRQYGDGPLDATQYGTASLGIPNSAGRVDDLEYDADSGRLFAAVATGGAWMSTDLGETWVEINGDLPATMVASLAWTSANGGRLVAVTGDGSFGGITGFPGIGAWYTDDIGDVAADQVRWQQATGVPVDALGFKVAVDGTAPEKVYVGTSKGLFRSTDGGTTFTNANLPTGDCAGVSNTQNRPECQLANVVTDVVVQASGGLTDVLEPKVVAAVGWRGGNWENPDGTIQSEGNGIYLSTDGGATFAQTAMSGFTPLDRRGRIELGAAVGADQDHDWLFAMVQDSLALNQAGCAVLDAPGPCNEGIDGIGSINTVIDGVYASGDFGETWTQVANTETFQNPASGSALNGTAAALGFQPGVQAWYNQFVAPDPGPTDPLTGAPTRLVVGLEEVWENTDSSTPTGSPPTIPPVHGGTLFRVVGRYFAGETCGFLDLGAPACPLNTQDPVTGADTTHPDQHSAVWIPGQDGDVSLFVGGDGGVFRQDVPAGSDLDNTQWGEGVNQGFHTLLPYSAAGARDGRVWFGLQDNGTGFIDPEGIDLDEDEDEDINPETAFRQYQTFGGDGFFVAVDPKNSDVAYYETPGASMNVTTDGGDSSTGIAPPADGGPYRFNNVFVMDPNDALQLGTAGSKVYISEAGPATTTPGAEPAATDWQEVFDLGTNLTPGERPEELAEGEVVNAMSAMDVERNAAYVGFCGVCDILNSPVPFENGIATNVNGDLPDIAGESDGWHVAAAKGLPNRFVTSIAIDPTDVRTIYVTLGGYSRKWAGPGTLQDTNPDIGEGHVFRSTDAGETFTNWSGNLPDAVATWVELRGDQLLVGTDVGAFASRADGAPTYAPLEDLPTTSVGTIQMKPHDPNTAYIALYGRGVWEYTFDDTGPVTAYERLWGSERVATSVAVSQEQFDAADTVVIATKSQYADALASVPLAAWEDAPILLTNPETLHPAVAAEIARLGATRALVAGGNVAVADVVDTQLEEAGLSVQRFAGEDRFETAALIAAQLPVPDRAYLVEGIDAESHRGWPDALAVGPVAAEEGRPILLTGTDTLPANTVDALAALEVSEVTVVGGTVAVSDAVRAQVEETGATLKEIAGKDRYETASLLADAGEGVRLTDHRVWLSRGDNWPDALAAGASVSANGGSLLLVPRTDLDANPAPGDWVADHCDDIEDVYVLGGVAAIEQPVVEQVAGVIDACDPEARKVIPPLVGEELATYGFETGADGWVASGSGPGQWTLRPPGDASGQAWRVEPYLDETTATISSPEIDQSGGALKVSISLAHNTEEGFDFVTADVRFADGTSAPLFGFSGTNASWPAFDTIEGTVLAPPGPVKVVVTMSSDQLVNGIGAAVDNVVVER